MMAEIKNKNIDDSLRPIWGEVKNLLEMFQFYLTEREIDKPIETLGEAVKDLRIIIGRILSDHFMHLSAEEEARFCSSLALMLAESAAHLPMGIGKDGEYVNYCISEILTAFEYAQEIKTMYPDDPIMQKILALDIPILRPFEYGTRGKMKLVPSSKKRIRHG